MPAPKQNPALVAAAIATALRLAKAAKMAKTASSVAKKPIVKVQPKQIESKNQVTKVSVNNKKGSSAEQDVYRGVGKKEAVSNFKEKAKTLGTKVLKVEVEKGGTPAGPFPRSNVKVVPQYKQPGGLNRKVYQTTVNNNSGIIANARKSGVAAERAARRITNNVKARKKPTIKITGK